MRSWHLTGLEFAALWEDMRESGQLPRPFIFTCRIPVYRDYLEAKRAAGAAVRDRLGGEFEEVLDVVARPDIRIVVNGVNLAADGAKTRVHAARRGSDGYLLEQVWGEPGEHGGEFIVREYGVVELGAAVVERIPDAEPGRLGAIDLSGRVDEGMDHEYGQSLVSEPTEDQARYRAEQFLRAPVTTIGTIFVGQGVSRFGPRHAARRVLEWRDLRDDGRYVIAGQGHPMAFGVDARGLTARIDSELAEVVRAIKDERR
ncbi:ESX secretion-associated protein EspG [Nocardia sp. NPDC051787]|uniref:ESX secretion-associated protein EspG n=1 Tax=Nocardia sp. NPDC051787 TaxID=3155415 RepID=UPI0034228A67